MAGITKEERQQLLRALKTADDNFKRGMYALAEPTYRKSIDVLGDGSAEICDCLMNLAHICSERKDLAEALKLKIRALLLHEERFGEDAIKTIALMDDIAGLYERLGRSEESRDMFERARKASERSLWADQQNEPDISDDSQSKPLVKELEIGFQYTETAKSALETKLVMDESLATAETSTTDPNEETMKLPRFSDDMIPSPPPKDPQLETLIMNKADFKAQQEIALKNKIAQESETIENSKTSIGGSAGSEKIDPNESRSKMIAAARADAIRSLSASQQQMKAADTPSSPADDIHSFQDQTLDDSLTTSSSGIKDKSQWKSIFDGQKNKVKDPSIKIADGAIKIADGDLSSEHTDLVKLDPAAFAPQPKPEKKELEVVQLKLFKSSKQRNIIIGLVAGCFVLLLFTNLLSSHNNPNQEFTSATHRYRTTDGEKLFFLSSQDDCEFVAGSETTKMKYRLYHGDLKDTLDAVFGSLLSHPYYLLKTKNGLIDEKGAELFAEASPELELADRIADLGRSAQLSFLKTHHYPKKLDELEASKRAYKNPFTLKPDKPTIQLTNFGKKTQSDDGGMRKKLFETVTSGVRWTNEPKRRPGAISCMSAVIHTKKGDISTFYVRGFDKNSLPIAGHDGKTVFAVVLDNGTQKPSARAHLPFSKSAARPHVAWLLDESNSGMLIWFRYGAAIMFALLAVLLGVASVNVSSDKLNATLKAIMIACAVLSLAYVFGGALP